MQLRKLQFLCLYAIIHIQYIAAFPSHGNPSNKHTLVRPSSKPQSSILYSDEVIVGKFNTSLNQFENFGKITIKFRTSGNAINMVGKRSGATWNYVNVWYFQNVQLSPLQNNKFEWSLYENRFEFQFADNQKADAFYQILQDAKQGKPFSQPTVSQSNQQNLDGVNAESTTLENQRSNGMPIPDEIQQIDNDEGSLPYTKGTATISIYKDNKWDTKGEGTIRIKQQNNKFRMVGIANKSTVINIEDFNKLDLWNLQDYTIKWSYESQIYGLQFSDADEAKIIYQAIKDAKETPITAQPEAAQELNNQHVTSNPETASHVTVPTVTTDNEDGSEAHIQSQQNPHDSISHPLYTIGINASVSTNSDNQDEWSKHGYSMIRVKKNQFNNKIQLLGIMVNNMEKIMNVADITNFKQPTPQDDTYYEWLYDNVEYELGFAAKSDADAFARAIRDALPVNPSTPAVIELQTHISPSTASSTNQHNVGSSSQSQQTNTDESSPQRYICTISTENYDCQIQGVHLKHNESYNFGLARENLNQIITFKDSVLQYLPKSLIEAFPKMKLLNLNNLNIENIEPNSFENAKNLETLYLEGNRLSSFPGLVLAGAPQLKTLVLSNNKLNSFKYGFNSNNDLSDLFVDRNKLTKLPSFEKIVHLNNFNGSHNKLARIDNDQFYALYQIEQIDLSHNLLNNLTLRLTSQKLKTVDVSNNRLTDLNVPLVMNRLYAENNLLSNFITQGECNLARLNLSNNTLKHQPNLQSCHSLGMLDLTANKVESFDFSLVSDSLMYLMLSHNHLFEILLPDSTNWKLLSLDLSNNKLINLPSLQSLKSLKQLLLNDNNLITIGQDHMPKSLNYISMANNEWNCDAVEKLTISAKDAQNIYCRESFENIRGICCKRHGNTLSDVLNKKVRDTYFHEKSNLNKLNEKCGPKTKYNRNNNIDVIRQAAALADEVRAAEIRKIQIEKNKAAGYRIDYSAVEANLAESKNYKQRVTFAIEKQRKTNRVTNEGLISDIEKLNRVINFIKERNTFNKNLAIRRGVETENSEQIFKQKKQEKDNLLSEIRTQTDAINTIKKDEKDKKREMDTLQKKVNRNAPAIHGKTGKS